MWEPNRIKKSEFNKVKIDNLLSGDIPAIIIQNFYNTKDCQLIVDRINDHTVNNFQNGKLNHIGPFLMAYKTKKEKYFKDAKGAKNTFEEIFNGMENPLTIIQNMINTTMPYYSLFLATDLQGNDYSPYVIRIHGKGKLISIHRDNVQHEGKEFHVSRIDQQLSCVLHLQESEHGGELVIYKKQWKVKDEKFRNIDFGYSSDVIPSSSESCIVLKLETGDLVIINPNHYHEVKEITGEIPRVSLGMFLGFFKKEDKMLAWA